ncbi:MAG: dienelactone hydrolase family protein [Lacisediminimonas sp.]|nr:dienelactone hydrolase family protein [Lacisediminimonas sp.]
MPAQTTSNDTATPAYRRDPPSPARGAIVVVHEIFGLTPHIKSLCDRLAAAGYIAIAPDLFAGQLDGGFLPYSPDGKKAGIGIKNQLGEEAMAAQIAQCAAQLGAQHKLAVIGFCLGGTLAWLCAAAPGVACVAGYYSVGLPRHLGLQPQVPVLMHFGLHDASIPDTDIAAMRSAHPTVEIHEYDAGHAFNRDDDAAHYQQASADAAWQRTMTFFDQHLRATP